MTTPGNIRGETAVGAAIGASASQPLRMDFPDSPTGSDTKSAAIAAALSAFLDTARVETGIYNASVDTLRQGLVQAPQAVEATDESGAAGIAASGEVYTT
jgi:hypothetical protein